MERQVLIAGDGMLFTNGKDVGKEIHLGECDKSENWHEIPETETGSLLNFY